MRLIFRIIRKDIILYSILTFLLSIAMVSEAFLMQFIVDSIKFGEKKYVLISIFIVIFLILQTLLYYYQQFLTAVLSKKSAYEYRKLIFKNIQQTSLRLVTGEKNDSILASLTTQIDQIEYNYFYSVYWGGYLLCQLVVAIVMSLYLNPLMSVLTICLSLPNLFVALLFKNSLEQKQEELINETNSSIAVTQDLIEGITDWKIANREPNIFRVFESKTLKLLEKQVKVEKFQYIVVSLNQLFSNVLYFGSWIVSGFLIIRGQLSLGSLIAFSQLLARISYPVYASSDLLSKYISGKKIVEILSKEFIFSDESRNYPDEFNVISFEHYFTNIDEKDMPFDKEFYKNKKYLLKGKSGSGKTTILKSILREYDDYSGIVKINGVDVRDIKESVLFDNIAYVSQKPHLFSASLRDNLTLFSEDFTDNEIVEVLKFVELSKWANKDCLDMMLSNDDIKLSGGEVKRVSLARALLMNKNILLLDEFSAGIDYETLLKIEKKLIDLDKMIIYVTHVDIDRSGKQFDDVIDLDCLFISS
ncbi:ABC transporter, ATP-binding protein [Streptococcus pneumoniae PCS8203]|uniref:ATP-binding cassette domain-containing protein n=2 Tax=Streptococcus pneumoniae TaxID=1313 RepID=UPI0002ADD1A6|nr:ABC transporter ATP-binding protein [Streptococcus pneumoniae]ELU57497.1 ABC transporter, ATP-binding protein [Streptococcus pneumoniae PCS8203]ELU58526.1 ABC transporter, ATP-binding protein [Streptococcus pneumoniae PCS8106]SNM29889.1 peptide ABC transporter ATP-binding protein/permease [Streptococcus pneumoniae]VKT18258.1 peptide ABC transporter ATP-binding protein/permease [Streptococcus pneumoniae]VKT78611.1 peptide ABC transporter ATP-binding protein/permease [Streptococcus pneumoniae